ncbi:peptidylprolyl isomerase [Candidatus Marinamargulisbacteria bacterium SCGC AG-343-D04]|nr:peptidylprolyl isomerase [Candidatus Marinamargulisbacteria bacterium SCGC AG-343-D04]
MTFFAEDGDIVTVHYTLSYTNGTIYDSSHGKDPLTFTLGSKEFIPGFESAIKSMEVGETKTITIPCKDAFGPALDELKKKIPIDDVPPHINKKAGQGISIQLHEQAFPLFCTIKEVTPEHILIDANFKQADKDFLLVIELIDLDADISQS